MKKDIKWLKEKVKGEYEYNRAKHNEEGFEGYAHREFVFKYVLGLLEQLDESEVLSQEWIYENREMYLINDTSENAVPVYKLQNLLVPKQEEQSAKTVADVIADFYKSVERLNEVLGTEVKELEEE